MRKILLPLLCILSLLTGAAAAEELVAPEIDVSLLTETNDNVFQSLNDWSYWEAEPSSTYYVDTEDLTDVTLEFYCTKSLMDQYVAMLQDTGFELVYYDPDAYLSDYKWQLKFVGAPHIPAYGTTSDGEDYHLQIEGYENNKYFLNYTAEIEMRDLGLRADGVPSGIDQFGQSASAGLYRLADGSFRTTDGRLTAAPGTAMVIRDGQTAIAEAVYASNETEWLYVTGYHRNEDFYYGVPANYAMQGDVYMFNDFVKNDTLTPDEFDSAADIMSRSRGREPFFLLAFDGERYQPRVHVNNRYVCVLVRTMYYEKNDAAVYYIYARMNRTEPAEIEALCVVSLK